MLETSNISVEESYQILLNYWFFLYRYHVSFWNTHVGGIFVNKYDYDTSEFVWHLFLHSFAAWKQWMNSRWVFYLLLSDCYNLIHQFSLQSLLSFSPSLYLRSPKKTNWEGRLRRSSGQPYKSVGFLNWIDVNQGAAKSEKRELRSFIIWKMSFSRNFVVPRASHSEEVFNRQNESASDAQNH